MNRRDLLTTLCALILVPISHLSGRKQVVAYYAGQKMQLRGVNHRPDDSDGPGGTLYVWTSDVTANVAKYGCGKVLLIKGGKFKVEPLSPNQSTCPGDIIAFAWYEPNEQT